jgi:DNA-binding MarR family transcriptional regulator
MPSPTEKTPEKIELEEMFMRKKPVRLLLNIKIGGQKYVSVLAKETDCTYSHTVKLLDMFQELGIVEFVKQGRIKYVKLTEDGLALASDFESVLRKFAKLKPKKK